MPSSCRPSKNIETKSSSSFEAWQGKRGQTISQRIKIEENMANTNTLPSDGKIIPENAKKLPSLNKRHIRVNSFV